MGATVKKFIIAIIFAILVVVTAHVISNVPQPLPPSEIDDINYEAGKVQLLIDTSATLPVVSNEKHESRNNKPYIVIDKYANRLFLRKADSVILEAQCSVGSGGELADSLTGRRWKFDTPSGIFVVSSMIPNPWWRKPDWAFIEEGQTVPKNETERFDNEMMGAYAIGFGDGFFIHGTIYERLLGVAVTHGCVRMGAEDIERLYKNIKIGTKIYVF